MILEIVLCSAFAGHGEGDLKVKEILLLRGVELRKILQGIFEKKAPVLVCYLSRGKWHKAQFLVVDIGSDSFDVRVLPPAYDFEVIGDVYRQVRKPHPVNVKLGQLVGMSVKYEGNKFIFGADVRDFSFSSLREGGGIISLGIPEQMEMIARRSFFRVRVPDGLQIEVEMWHRHCRRLEAGGERLWCGRLVDISAGGLQVAVLASDRPDFRKRQFVKVRFCPLPSEETLELSAQIRDILPTVDGEYICFGLQVVGLEASREGRETLGRLAGVTEFYYELGRGKEVLGGGSQVGLRAPR